MRTTRVCHIITGLSTGGAEMMLYKLLSKTDRTSFDPEVISLSGVGPIGKMIEELGVRVRGLGMQRGLGDVRSFLKFVHWLRRCNPHLVQTWMYHSDFIGGLGARLAGIPVIWGIHHENLDTRDNKFSTIWIAKTCARLSRVVPTAIICSSKTAARVHTAMGYTEEKMLVIPNGFDLSVFRFDPLVRTVVRKELGIPPDAPTVGMIGRFHPLKDHRTFVRAASELNRYAPNVHYLLCGEGVTSQNELLTSWIRDAGLSANFHLLGRRDDMPSLYSAMDIASSSSRGESFPNVVGEAMACGVPVVGSDSGAIPEVMGSAGLIVPEGNAPALAEALQRAVFDQKVRAHLIQQGLERVEQELSVEAMSQQLLRFYNRILEA